MNVIEKLTLLAENMDVVDPMSHPGKSTPCHSSLKKNLEPQITFAGLPGGGSIPLLKAMVTSICEKNCLYCAFRSGRDTERVTFSADELADTFLNLVNKDIAKGLFLSSGILVGGVYSQDRIIDTAEILRKKKNFQGYMHLKIMPGAEKDQIRQLMLQADRVSINLEAPNPHRLEKLAPKKSFFEELYTRLKWVQEIRSENVTNLNWRNRWPSLTTQFVVGPAHESDAELIRTSQYLFKEFHLARIYYMAFSPVTGTPFSDLPAENPIREHRLYQSSFLLRDYQFSLEDFEFDLNGNLSLENDPKSTWAKKNLAHNPLEINKASYERLIRVPGIGSIKARKIISYRRHHLIRNEDDLKNLGVSVNSSGAYLLLNGRRIPRQLSLEMPRVATD